MHKNTLYRSQSQNLIASICFLTFFSACGIPLSQYLNKESQDNNIRTLATLGIVASLGNCETGGDLWARNIRTQTSYCVPVELVSVKSNLLLYKQRGLSVNTNLEAFATEFNDSTYPKIISAFGEPSDVDRDGKIKILILDIIDGATSNSAYVAGFFDPVNYFADGTVSSLRSNFAEILYLDGRELIANLSSDPTALASTAAHEFQHLIRYPYMNAARVTDSTWINEGTSEVASDIAGFGPQTARLSCFRGTESNRCPNGANGTSLLVWESNASSSTILKQYAMAYAYMRYLYDISGNNASEKNDFFKKSVQGNSAGVRAGTASQLMTVFRGSNRFNASLLGSDNPTVFFNTFMLFFGQASSATQFSSVNYVNSSLAVVSSDISNAYSAYPFESSLNDLISTPLTAVSGNLTFGTGSAYVLARNYDLNTELSPKYQNMGTVKNVGSTRTLLGWGAYSSVSPLTSVRDLLEKPENSNGKDRFKSLMGHPSGSGDTSHPLCGTQFIDEPAQTVGSIPVELPASKNDNIP